MNSDKKYLCNKCNNDEEERERILQEFWTDPGPFLNPWLPTPITTIKNSINLFFGVSSRSTRKTKLNSKGTIISNICYSLQYLEYLEESLQQLYFTSVLKREQYKTYCTVGWSIIESLLTHICGINIEVWVPNLSRIIEDKLIIKDQKNQKLDWEDGVIWEQSILYKMIDYARKLRNQTHLYSEEYNTDYNIFIDKHLIVIKYIIGELLRFKWATLYKYLDIPEEIKKRVTEVPWAFSSLLPLPYLRKDRYQTFQNRNLERNKL